MHIGKLHIGKQDFFNGIDHLHRFDHAQRKENLKQERKERDSLVAAREEYNEYYGISNSDDPGMQALAEFKEERKGMNKKERLEALEELNDFLASSEFVTTNSTANTIQSKADSLTERLNAYNTAGVWDITQLTPMRKEGVELATMAQQAYDSAEQQLKELQQKATTTAVDQAEIDSLTEQVAALKGALADAIQAVVSILVCEIAEIPSTPGTIEEHIAVSTPLEKLKTSYEAQLNDLES